MLITMFKDPVFSLHGGIAVPTSLNENCLQQYLLTCILFKMIDSEYYACPWKLVPASFSILNSNGLVSESL